MSPFFFFFFVIFVYFAILCHYVLCQFLCHNKHSKDRFTMKCSNNNKCEEEQKFFVTPNLNSHLFFPDPVDTILSTEAMRDDATLSCHGVLLRNLWVVTCASYRFLQIFSSFFIYCVWSTTNRVKPRPCGQLQHNSSEDWISSLSNIWIAVFKGKQVFWVVF